MFYWISCAPNFLSFDRQHVALVGLEAIDAATALCELISSSERRLSATLHHLMSDADLVGAAGGVATLNHQVVTDGVKCLGDVLVVVAVDHPAVMSA